MKPVSCNANVNEVALLKPHARGEACRHHRLDGFLGDPVQADRPSAELELDEPVQTYLPWFRVADADASKTITVRQLLNMNSGIPQSIGQEQIANFDLSDSAIEDNVRALANVELNVQPGERY